MAVPVLVLTSIRSLGELIQRALDETALYRATLVENGRAGLDYLQKETCLAAIVDFGAVKDPLDFVAQMRGECERIKIIGMPASPNDADTELYQSVVDGWLAMPFYLPNLLDMLADLVTPAQQNSSVSPNLFSARTTNEKRLTPAPEWLQDVNRVAQHLTRLSLQSAAQAALITRGEQLWAYAGQLPQLAAEELARLVGHYWARDGGSDLARFVRLESTDGEYMIYATSLGDDYVLALVFEAETPFTEMRTQAGSLARQLSTPPAEGAEQDAPAEAPVPTAESDPEATPPEHLPEFPADWRPDAAQIAAGRHNFFEDLLKDMEIPVLDELVQDEPSAASADTPPNGLPHTAEPQGEAPPSDVPHPPQAAPEHPPQRAQDALPVAESSASSPSPASLADTLPTKTNAEATVAVDVLEAEPDEDDFAPVGPSQPEPAVGALHNLTYACVLVPRLPHHHLVGDLAEALTKWTRQLSMAFGWRLEHLALRPDYLHWIAVVPPEASPGLMVHHLREQTSLRIFADFPRLERENPSGEFWAADYLIVNGRDPFSRQMVQEFISNVRSRQGAQ